MAEKFTLFSNGTEFMDWTARNCDRCVKAVYYNNKKGYQPQYRCAIQEHIETACIDDGMGNKSDYEATHSRICPYLQTERKAVVKSPKRVKKNEKQLELF